MRELGVVIGGAWRKGDGTLSVRSPHDEREVARVGRAGAETLARALDSAAAARPAMAAMPPHERAEVLERAAGEIASRRTELAAVLVEEAGKPLGLARVEVDRCVETLLDAARVARTPAGELLDLGGFPSGTGRFGLLRRVPIGVVVGIAPFNFPLNLVAHKLAPAVAAGCPIVLKPASQTPSPALLLGEAIARAGLPEGALSVVPCSGAEASTLLDDQRVRLLTFTGSAEVGWGLKQRLWDRRVALELGGNAAVLIEPDGGEPAAIADRVALGAFAFAGQSCISVQRVLVHRSIAAEVRDALVAATRGFATGDPAEASTLCGPMISAGDADRVEAWIGEARAAGAHLLTEPRRERSVVWPTLLEDVPHDARLWTDEAFAPVAVIEPYDRFEDALALVNESRYGLQAGVFTTDIGKINRAHEMLAVGAIIQGDIPSWRTDPMPYGGVKASGIGREGARFAVEEMTEPRLLVIKR